MPELKESLDADSSPKPLASWYAQGLSDGLGDRLLMFDNTGAPSLELLRFRPDVGQVPGFETALREQVDRLGQFQHPAFAPARSVQRLEPDDDLALISNYTPGKRLSEVLHYARGPKDAAVLIRQLAPALLLLHNSGTSHGALSPDRIVVSPDGRLTIVEHAVGPAIDSLNLRTPELASMGIAVPPTADSAPRLDVASDWYQFGLIALSVLIGRPVAASELPELETLLDELSDPARPDGPLLSPVMRQWLDRTLQISGGRIESGADAQAALDDLQREAREGSRRIESSIPEPASARAPAPSPSAPQRVRPLSEKLSPYELAQLEGREPPPQVRTLFERPSTVERKKPSAGRLSTSTALIAALAVIAVLEAVVIGAMARALWGTSQPAIVLETAPSGENVVVIDRSQKAPSPPLAVAPVAPPHGWVTLFATPHADVFIDGKPVGRTPLGPLALAPGGHAVTFQHPSGATDRRQVKVTSGGTTRVIGYPRR